MRSSIDGGVFGYLPVSVNSLPSMRKYTLYAAVTNAASQKEVPLTAGTGSFIFPTGV
jgi:hypothetical protein